MQKVEYEFFDNGTVKAKVTDSTDRIEKRQRKKSAKALRNRRKKLRNPPALTDTLIDVMQKA